MPKGEETVFLVNAHSDPVVLKINGRATYLNSAPAADFLNAMIKRGCKRFLVDMLNCTGMDSTFLGILAGIGVDLLSQDPPGKITLVRLGARNLELARNVGLHRVLDVESGGFPMSFGAPAQPLSPVEHDRIEQSRLILRAHEHLVEIDETNKTKFQDVISFLKNQAENP